MVTIREVAKEANVSIGTVSRYLNGFQLKKNNMENIKLAIEKLGYQENIIAKGLKNNRSMSIGVVINTLTDVFATSIVSYLENYLEENNYSLLLCDYQNDYNKLEKKLDFLKSRSVDGIIIFHLEKDLDILYSIKQANIPIIAVDAPIEGFKSDVVLVNNYEASYRATEELYNNGHREIGIIAGDNSRYIGKERLNGYRDFMISKNIFNQKNVAMADYSKDDGYKKTKKLLRNDRITAIYSTNYYMTLGTMQALYEEKFIVPDDISVIGFDHFELSDIIQPKLTVIEQPIKQMVKEIGELIINRVTQKNYDYDFQTLILETNLLKRDSVKKNKKGL